MEDWEGEPGEWPGGEPEEGPESGDISPDPPLKQNGVVGGIVVFHPYERLCFGKGRFGTRPKINSLFST